MFPFSTDKDNIDLSFYDYENQVPKTENKTQNDSSKIVTKAVIEVNPENCSFTKGNDKARPTYLNSSTPFKFENVDSLSYTENNFDAVSSPTSSLEMKMLSIDQGPSEWISNNSLMNCLAFNDSFESQNSKLNSISIDGSPTDSSSHSPSGSTDFSTTSGFTNVSSLPSSSCSSFASDSSENLHTNDNESEDRVDKLYIKDIKTESVQDSENELCNKRSSSSNGNSDESKNESEKNEFEQEVESFIKNITENEVISEKDELDHNLENSVLTNYSEDEYESDVPSIEEYDVENSSTGKTSCTGSEGKSSDIKCKTNAFSRKQSDTTVSILEEELGDISLASQTSSKPSSVKPPNYRGSNKSQKKKKYNLTFSREEIIKIERDNLTLLKKIMAHSKPKAVSLNQPFGPKKTSTAINRAKQQKKIEQDNYILYSKISSMSRTKKVF